MLKMGPKYANTSILQYEYAEFGSNCTSFSERGGTYLPSLRQTISGYATILLGVELDVFGMIALGCDDGCGAGAAAADGAGCARAGCAPAGAGALRVRAAAERLGPHQARCGAHACTPAQGERSAPKAQPLTPQPSTPNPPPLARLLESSAKQ